jgi:hypothetical protein
VVIWIIGSFPRNVIDLEALAAVINNNLASVPYVHLCHNIMEHLLNICDPNILLNAAARFLPVDVPNNRDLFNIRDILLLPWGYILEDGCTALVFRNDPALNELLCAPSAVYVLPPCWENSGKGA